MSTSTYAIRFLSGKLQGREYALPSEGDLVIGRASGLDLVLLEDMVSRRHAELTVRRSGLVIHDLDSTNGTFVNGEKVSKARLREGDRVLIGTTILKIIPASGAPSLPPSDVTSVDESTRQSSMMSGRLEDVPVPDLLQLFSSSRRSGVLFVRGTDAEGRIRLRDGHVFHAGIGPADEMDPMKALCRIIGWPRGDFRFEPPDDSVELLLELEDTTENLLVRAMHQLDEFRRIRGELPPAETTLAVPQPLDAPLGRLNALSLDIFQLAHNEGRVDRILDRSPATDYETASALLELLTGGYLVRR